MTDNKTLHDYVRGFSLDSIVTLIEANQESWGLKLRSDGRVGYLYFSDGEIVAAQTQGLRGETAVLEMVQWEDLEILILKTSNRPREIHSTMMQLMLEGNRIGDEKADCESAARRKYLQAVAHIEGFRFKEGQALIVDILKQHTKNHRAWLWYSRCIGAASKIKTAISRAILLAPEDDEIRREHKRVGKALEAISDERVKRCPYCWAPLNRSDTQCPHCGLWLVITEKSLESPNDKGDAGVLDACVKRFAEILGREKNLYASYYLALSHFNMGDADRTLELLQETLALSGDQPFFEQQLFLYRQSQREDNETISTLFDNEVQEETSEGAGKTVLVVEDSRTTRRVIAVALNARGYEFMEAGDGLQALSLLSSRVPDLILLDVILPKMNGFEILSLLKNKKEYKHIPVVMLTSKDGFMSRMKGRIGGASTYLTKPFRQEHLLETIGKLI